jgi:hypothetical protein
LKNLCEASKYLYQIALPILYEEVTVNAEDERFLNEVKVVPLVQARHSQRNLLLQTKDMRVASNFHINLVSRCVHGSSWASEDGSSRFSQMAVKLMSVLEGCRDNGLESFTYVLRSDARPGLI